MAGFVTGALIPFMPTSAFALPQGGTVAAGAATISTPTATSMRIEQTTDRAVVDWTRFNIAANESVHFQQPNAAAIALNRVSGQEPSAIFGSLSATGQLFLLNPSGILFGASSRVDVGALTASTLAMSNQDFLTSQYRFTQDPSAANAAVVNQGLITAGPGGYVALLGAAAHNDGVIQAQLGSIALASGKAVTLDLRGDGLIQFVLTDAVSGSVIGPNGTALSAVSNTGTLQADGGMVTLHAKVAAGLVRSVVNQEGIIRATSLVNRGGVITLVADGVNAIGWNKGVLDVSAGESGAAPGLVSISAPHVGQSGTILATGAEGSAGGRVEMTSTTQSGLFANSLIDVSGVGNANAGSVRVWSDNYTMFSSSATILARGGETGGHGGFVEVSGQQALNVAGFVDARAPQGHIGTLLLDPHNITVATGGVGLLTDVDQFADTPASDVTIAPATINAAGANVVLQANNDITFTNAVSIAGAGISLTAQAGRSIIVNANITTNNAPISLTANDTTANGVSDANRDAGIALITMAAGATLTSAGSNITITMNTGAGLTNSASGNITLEGVNAGAGHVLVVNNGPTAGSGIGRSSANELITATSAALDVNGAGGGGEIATLAAPIRVSVTNLEARSQSLGAYFTSPTLAVNIGGATLGGLTGISTSANGILSITTTGTSITTTEALSANGSGTVTLTAAGAASSITANAALTSGSGAIALTANSIALGAPVTGTGTLTLAPSTASTTVGIADGAAGAFNLTGAELDLFQNGFSSITIGHASGTGAVDVGAYTFKDAVSIRASGAAGSVTVNGALATGSVAGETGTITLTSGTGGSITLNGSVTTTDQALTINAGTGSLTQAAGGAITSGAGTITLTADTIALGAPITGTGTVALAPSTSARTVGVADGAVGPFNVTSAELDLLQNGFSIIQIGHAGGPGGAVDVRAYTFKDSVLIRNAGTAGSVVINGALATGSAAGETGTITLTADNGGITLNDTVTTTDQAVSISARRGTLTQAAGAAITSGSGAITLTGNAIVLGAPVSGTGTLTLASWTASMTIGIADGAAGAFNLSSAELDLLQNGFSSITIGHATGTGAVDVRAYTFKDALSVRATGAAGSVTVNGALATGSAAAETGAITLTSGSGGITLNNTVTTTDQALTVNAGTATLTQAAGAAIASGSGAIALTAGNGVAVGAAITTTGAYIANADSDSNGTGLYTQGVGSSVSSAAVTITAVDMDLQGPISAGANDVTLMPSTAGATIGIGDASQNFNLSNAEISQITTTGTLLFGGTSGGILVGTNEVINAGSRNLELLTTGTLTVDAANGMTTTGNLTFSADAMTLGGGSIIGGNVTLRPASTATTIGVEDNSQMLSLTNAELNTISTPGTLTIGSSSNTGSGIRIAVDAAVSLGSTNVSFVTAGSIVMGTNTFATTGNVTLSAGGAGAPLALDWEFDEGSGTTAIDQSGNGNNGTLVNSPIRLVGGILQFDGTNHVILNPFGNIPAGEVTVEFFMRSTDLVNNGAAVSYAIVPVGVPQSDEELAVMNYRNLELSIKNNGGVSSGASANDGSWHHIVASWRSMDGQSKLYKDGVQVYSGTVSHRGSLTPGGGFVVAQDQDSVGGGFEADQAFIGDLDFVRIWNRALSASDIQQLAASPSSYASLFSTGTVTSLGGAISAGNLTLNATSVGSSLTPVMLGTVSGQLSGTLSGTAPTDVFNVKAVAASTINLGPVTATSGGIGHPVTIDSTSGSILHVTPGTDIDGGVVNLWGSTIDTNNLVIVTTSPPVYCNGSPCGLAPIVNGAGAINNAVLVGLSQSGRYLLGATPEESTLLTAGVLPDYIYRCLDQEHQVVVCMAGAVWHNDDGTTGALPTEFSLRQMPTKTVRVPHVNARARASTLAATLAPTR